MPFQIEDPELAAGWDPSGGFTLVDEGVYRANAFSIEKKLNDNGKYYSIDFRIDGGTFDGEDVTERYVGLQAKTIFRLYDILKAAGTLDQYYVHGIEGQKGRWVALPTPEELQGKAVFIQVEHEPFQKKVNGELQFDANRQPVMLNSARITRYFPVTEPMPAFKPTAKRTAAPAAPTAPQQGFPAPGGNAFAGTPAAPPVQQYVAPVAPGVQPGVPAVIAAGYVEQVPVQQAPPADPGW